MIENITSQESLDGYLNGDIKITPLLNIWMNDHSKDWYAELGKYLSGEPKRYLKKKLLDFINFKRDRGRFAGIFFITSLDFSKMKKAFGEPLKHSEYGEGFVPSKEYAFESYFLKINGSVYHIGRDHRGTSFEVPEGHTSQQVFDDIKTFLEEYS